MSSYGEFNPVSDHKWKVWLLFSVNIWIKQICMCYLTHPVIAHCHTCSQRLTKSHSCWYPPFFCICSIFLPVALNLSQLNESLLWHVSDPDSWCSSELKRSRSESESSSDSEARVLFLLKCCCCSAVISVDLSSEAFHHGLLLLCKCCSDDPVSHEDSAKSRRAFMTDHPAEYQQPKQMTSVICFCSDFQLAANEFLLSVLHRFAGLNRWTKLEHLCAAERWHVWLTAALKHQLGSPAFAACLSPCCCTCDPSLHWYSISSITLSVRWELYAHRHAPSRLTADSQILWTARWSHGPSAKCGLTSLLLEAEIANLMKGDGAVM